MTSLRIGFLENHLSIRGSSVALYDYAHYVEDLLHHKSYIITRPCFSDSSPDFDTKVYDKFSKRFEMLYFTSWLDNPPEMRRQIQALIDTHHLDVLVVLKSGYAKDGLYGFTNVLTIIVAVFDTREPHGDLFVTVSDWNNELHGTNVPVLPHIVEELPFTTETLRSRLQIPEDALVFGRIGGLYEFDDENVQQAILEVVNRRPNTYALLVNTKWDPLHPHIIHLPSTTDKNFKSVFVNSCDAMIYGRRLGETFGLAIAEFSMKNKPIFGMNTGRDKHHLRVLGDRSYFCSTKKELINAMMTFDAKEVRKGQWNAYAVFTPQRVMQTFSEMIQSKLNATSCDKKK